MKVGGGGRGVGDGGGEAGWETGRELLEMTKKCRVNKRNDG